ncbi:MAG: AraC family transcriptional regulator [Clostridia bacterium]|nr:AraC family transcriptional regulator [Clostridia bacterium]
MNIFVRFANETNFLPNSFMTKAYDDRFFFVSEGQGKIIFEGEEHPLSPNTLCYYPSGTSYQPISSKEAPMRFITVNFDFERNFEEMTKTMPPVKVTDFISDKVLYKDISSREGIFRHRFVIENASAYRNLFCEFIQVYKSNTDYGKRIAESILQTLCYKLLNKENESYDELYLKIKKYIDSNYKNIRNNKDISNVFCYHDYYLNKIFKNNSGITIHKYIIDMRLQDAAQLISSTQLPIYDIAFDVGFTSVAHFSTAFKSKYSLTPSDFRKDNLKKTSNLI